MKLLEIRFPGLVPGVILRRYVRLACFESGADKSFFGASEGDEEWVGNFEGWDDGSHESR